jgi:hypothetical protein
MKPSFLFALLLSAAAPHLHGDILLGGPGVPVGSKIATKVPFRETYDLTGSYKFVFAGIQAKGDTLGAPGASGVEGNGGQFHVSATVFDNTPTPTERAGNLTFVDIQDFNSSPLKTLTISPAAVYKATTVPITITTVWSGEGNAHKPTGTFVILGEYQKQPPVPVGKLDFAVGEWLLVEAGSQPDGVATITRE